MKLNITFIPVTGEDKEFKFVAYGDKYALYKVADYIQREAFCTNVYMTEDKSNDVQGKPEYESS